VSVSFDDVAGADVCTVKVPSSGRPVLSKPHEGGRGASQFWVRDGNRTEQLHGDEMVQYQETTGADQRMKISSQQ